MSELKPCPFCGKNPEDEVLRLGRTFAVAVTCPNPDCDPVLRDEWNTRPIEDALRARVAELEWRLARVTEAVSNLNRYGGSGPGFGGVCQRADGKYVLLDDVLAALAAAAEIARLAGLTEPEPDQ